MGNNSGKQMPNSSSILSRPHSVLGVRNGELTFFGSPEYDFQQQQLFHQYHLQQRQQNQKQKQPNQQLQRNTKFNKSGRAILPPIPRSQSFHQILRPTENGVNLLKKGTIRGFNESNQNNKSFMMKTQEKRNDLNNENELNNELNAILRQRRCKSETDLTHENDDSDELSGEYKSIDSRNEQAKNKNRSNGVAGKIQKKYKAPSPNVPPTTSSSTAVNYSGQQLDIINLSCSSPSTTQMNASLPFEVNYSANNFETKINSQSPKVNNINYNFSNNGNANINNGSNYNLNNKLNQKQVESKTKINLVRRSSENSHLKSKEIGRDLSDSTVPLDLLSKLKSRNLNQVRSNERSLIYDSRNARNISTKANNEETAAQISANRLANKSASKLNHSPSQQSSSSLSITEQLDVESLVQFKLNNEKLISMTFLNGDTLDNDSNLHENGEQVNSTSSGSNRFSQKQSKFNKQANMPITTFYDNFILKRATPTAGLKNPNSTPQVSLNPARHRVTDLFRRSLTSQFKNIDNDYNIKNVYHDNEQLFSLPLNTNDHDNFLFEISTKNNPLINNANTCNSNNSHNQPLSLPHLIPPPPPPPQFSIPPPPPPLPLNSQNLIQPPSNWRTEQLMSTSSTANKEIANGVKGINSNSYISDSANYSDDEDEEDEIRVILKPTIPPPRRPPFTAEKFIITEDIFTANSSINNLYESKFSQGRKHDHDKCWTPLEDLTSSDEDEMIQNDIDNLFSFGDELDDGINCDQYSDDDDFNKQNNSNNNNSNSNNMRNIIRDNNGTRFTLKNQLRTLIQNNKQRYVYP